MNAIADAPHFSALICDPNSRRRLAHRVQSSHQADTAVQQCGIRLDGTHRCYSGHLALFELGPRELGLDLWVADGDARRRIKQHVQIGGRVCVSIAGIELIVRLCVAVPAQTV